MMILIRAGIRIPIPGAITNRVGYHSQVADSLDHGHPIHYRSGSALTCTGIPGPARQGPTGDLPLCPQGTGHRAPKAITGCKPPMRPGYCLPFCPINNAGMVPART